jgi:hypothetical protein
VSDLSGASEGASVDTGPVLAFMNEVAGGRRLLDVVKTSLEEGATGVAVAAPQNVPAAGQIVDPDEVRDAAQSRVDVTQAVFAANGIDSAGAVLDPHPQLALDDAVRAFKPSRVLISCLSEMRLGLLRRDFVEWARERFTAEVVHIPVRLEDDAVSQGITHTLVVATQTVASKDLLARLAERAAEQPHRYTFVCPRSGAIGREEVCERLAGTLAAMYAQEIDATGAPMSPEPFAAVQNAIEHYRIDDILISTFAGQGSAWLDDGLIDRVKGITDKPVEHVESRPDGDSAPAHAVAEAEAVGA